MDGMLTWLSRLEMQRKTLFCPLQPFLRPFENKGIATKMISESFGKVADKFLKQGSKKDKCKQVKQYIVYLVLLNRTFTR